MAAVVGAAGAVAANARPDDKNRAKVEVRRAEAAPADGLTAAKVAGTNTTVYLHRAAELNETDIEGARAAGDVNDPSIEVTLTKDGAKKLARLSADHANKPLAILVDGKVIAAPVIRANLGGTVRITGAFTPDEAVALAKAINGK